MSKHINLLGYSLWISDSEKQRPDEISTLKHPSYSPGVLAAYCLFTNFSIGTLLYSVNVFRRGYRWRGSFIGILSVTFLLIEVFVSTSSGRAVIPTRFPLNALIAICLYKVERPHFNRAIRDGRKQARWWLPLVWIATGAWILLLLQSLLK